MKGYKEKDCVRLYEEKRYEICDACEQKMIVYTVNEKDKTIHKCTR